jgi:hypothetical protein
MSQATSVLIQATSPLSVLTSMSANGSSRRDTDGSDNESNHVGDAAEVDDGDDVDPLLMATVWEDGKMQKTCSADGRKSWKCGYCNTTFSGHNATKAVAHLCRTRGQDIAPCKQYHFIPETHRRSHQDLSDRKLLAKRKRKVMHENIDRSIDVHQKDLAVAVGAKVWKKRTHGDSTSTTASTLSASVASTPSSRSLSSRPTLVTSRPLPKVQSTNLLKKPPAMLQLSIHNGPNPDGESALTAAVADMIHSMGLPFSLSTDPKFRRVIKLARNVGSNYMTPTRQRIGSDLLELNYNMYIRSTKEVLLHQAETYGLTLYGDGATVKKMPLINILCAGVDNPAAVLEIVNCSSHLQNGGKKDASYIAGLFNPHLDDLDPNKTLVDLLYFDGASNVQKAGSILGAVYPRVTCLHGSEHVVSLFFGDICKISAIQVFIRFYRRVYKWFGSGSHHLPYAIFSKHVSGGLYCSCAAWCLAMVRLMFLLLLC